MATKLGQSAAELARTNPWWRDASWQDRDTDLRPVRESELNYRPAVLADLQPGGLYLLRGPRRVGKTVAVKQTIADLIAAGVPPQHLIRVAADGWAASDIRTVVSHVALPPLAPGALRWWFLDEVTAVTGDWATQVKWLRDNDPDFASATVVLTGSSAPGLTAASGVLAGRRGRVSNADRTLMPMGFRTFVATFLPAAGAQLPRLGISELHTRQAAAAYRSSVVWLDELVRLWELYLRYGGFAASVAAAVAGQPVPDWFTDAMFAVIHADAFAASHLAETQTSALVDRVWASTSTPINLTNVGSDVGVDKDVVSRHVGYLRDAYLLWACPQLDKPWLPNDRAQDKLYPIDPLVGRLAHLRNPARPDLDPTVLAEAQTGMALRRAAHAAGRAWTTDTDLFHVRTPSRKEIDFVGEALAGTAVEGKYVETGKWAREAATVNASGFLGILTTRNVLDCAAANAAWAVPAAVLAALVDV